MNFEFIEMLTHLKTKSCSLLITLWAMFQNWLLEKKMVEHPVVAFMNIHIFLIRCVLSTGHGVNAGIE